MTCYECGSNKLEIEESSMGTPFVCCMECEWVMPKWEYDEGIEDERNG